LTHRLGSIPRAVWAVTLLWCSLLLGASVVWPASYGLDEPQHIDMAYDYSAHPFTFYGPGRLQLSLAGVGVQHAVPGYPPQVRLAVAPIPPRGHRPTFAQLGGHAFEKAGQPDQMVEHPPLYYWLEALVLRFPGVSGLAWDLQVWLMRLLSIAFMSPVPLLCWSTARRLLAKPFGRFAPLCASRLAVLAAVCPLSIPNLVRDGSSVDNDTLLIFATSVLLWGLARVVCGDLGLRTAAIVSAALAVALWTKGFALALPPLILVAYLFAPSRYVRGGRVGDSNVAYPTVPAHSSPSKAEAVAGWRARVASVRRPVGVCAIGALAGSFWWVRNVIDYGTLQVNGFGTTYALEHLYGTPDYKGTLLHFIPPFLDGFALRIWGEVGLPDSPSPGPLVIYGWLFVALVGIVAALAVRSRPGTRRRLAILGLGPLAYFAITFEGSYSAFREWAHDGVRADQGRYIYGGIVVIAVLSAVGWFSLVRPRFHRRLAPIALCGAILTNGATWLLILRSWYQPVGDPSYGSGTEKALGALLRWSPLPVGLTILVVFILPCLAGLVCLAEVWRDTVPRPPLRVGEE
jgi:hypothetical protein